MLEFKIKVDKENIEYGEVQMWNVGVSEDWDTITGFTDADSFSDSDTEIYIEFDKNGKLIKHPMHSRVVEVNGSAKIDAEYRVEDSENGPFVRYSDGLVHYVEYRKSSLVDTQMCIVVNGEIVLIKELMRYKKGVSGGFLEKYYGILEKREVFVVNDTITINGNTYDVVGNKDNFFTVTPIDSDKAVSGVLFDTKRLRLVTIEKNPDVTLTPYACNNCDNIYYFFAPSNTSQDNYEDYRRYYMTKGDSGYTCNVHDVWGDLDYNDCVYKITNFDDPQSLYKVACCVQEDGVERPCFDVYNGNVNCDYDTDTVFFGVKETNAVLKYGDIIIAKERNEENVECTILEEEIEDGKNIRFIVYQGKKYYEDLNNGRDYLEEVVEDDGEYLTLRRYPIIRDTFDQEERYEGKFYKEGCGISISVSGSGYTITDELFSSRYDFKKDTSHVGKYVKFVIKGRNYYADNDADFITIDGGHEIQLIVNGIENDGLYVCKEYGRKSVSLLKTIVENTQDYDFFYLNTMLPLNFNEMSFFVDSSRISIPISFTSNNSIKVNREDSINSFVSDEIDKRINRIVDMEKDIYYPAFCGDEGVSIINELSFKLHFRTRDLDKW